ncbi:MAG: hypothetical protein GXO32_05010 [Crenarchaeota archaeon]|nr:hypothetical protein [Thermoproteota archaeon]
MVEAVWSVGSTVLESREVSFGARPVVKLLRIGVVRNGSAYRVTQVELLIGNAGNAPLFIAPSTASVSVGGTLCAARLEPLVVFPGSEYAVDLHLSRCLVHTLENVPIVIAIRGYPRGYVANFSADLARYVAR